MHKAVIIFLFSCSIFATLKAQMNNEKMEKIIQSIGDEVNGEPGNWQVIYGDRMLFILTDEAHNRMRIFTPIGEKEELEKGQLTAMLEANFHSALDAKYGLFNEFVVSLFTHPLSELTKTQFLDAMRQVALAAENFGTTYSSTELIFGGNETQPERDSLPADKRVNQKPKKKT